MNADQIVRDFCAAWSHADIDTIIDSFTDDAVYHNMPMDPMTSKEAIRGFIEPFMEPCTGVEWTVSFIAEDANGVVLTERVDAFMFCDKRIALPVMGTFELDNGKIARWRDYFDLRDFENQMAALQG